MVVGGERERASSLLRFLGSATDSFAGSVEVSLQQRQQRLTLEQQQDIYKVVSQSC